MDEHEARLRQTVALESIAHSLQTIAANMIDGRAGLIQIAEAAKQMANDDPLSRVERALERAPEVLGFDPSADRNQQPFDNRFAGQPIEERLR